MYHTWSLSRMFLKHFGDLLFQITTDSEISEKKFLLKKKAAVRHYLDFLPPFYLLDF